MADANDRVEEAEVADDSQAKKDAEVEETTEKTAEQEVEESEKQREIPDYEPPVRLSVLDRIKERRQKRAETVETHEVQENEVELSPEAERALNSKVDPIVQHLAEKEVDLDVRTFLADPDNKQFKPYSKIAQKYLIKHPTLTVEDAFTLAARQDLQDLGAKRAKEAEIRAKKNSLGGGTVRKLEKTPLDMSDPKVRKMLDDKLAREGRIDFEQLV